MLYKLPILLCEETIAGDKHYEVSEGIIPINDDTFFHEEIIKDNSDKDRKTTVITLGVDFYVIIPMSLVKFQEKLKDWGFEIK